MCAHMGGQARFILRIHHMCTVCQVGNASQRRDQVHGSGAFLLLWLESKASLCHVVSCCAMLCHGRGRAHSYCSLASKVREGSEKTLCSAGGFNWLILKANEIQELGAHDER